MTPAPTTQTRSIMLWREYPAPVTCQSMGSQLAELVVGDEPLLLRPQPLDLAEQLGVAGLRNVEPELLRLQANRVDPALLPEHDTASRADELRGVGLDRGRVVELARDGAALPR